MRPSKKTAQGLSGAHAYSRLPFVSPVRGACWHPKAVPAMDKTSWLVVLFFIDRGKARQPEALSLGSLSLLALEVTRCSSWVFLGGVHHERTKQTLARVRPGSTGGSARGYERSRVPRPEHLNPWQAERN